MKSSQSRPGMAPNTFPFQPSTGTGQTVSKSPFENLGTINSSTNNTYGISSHHNPAANQYGGPPKAQYGSPPVPVFNNTNPIGPLAATVGATQGTSASYGTFQPTGPSMMSQVYSNRVNTNLGFIPGNTQCSNFETSSNLMQHQTSISSQSIISEIQHLNSPSYFVRPTVAKVPNSASLKQKAHIPVGLVFQPLANPPPGYPEVPTVSFGSSGIIVRCKPCRTYINPFVKWEAGGRRWVCNMCGFSNETPSFYFCGLDEQGGRTDRYERPELSIGSVEFIATAEYMVRPPQPPVYFIVLDVSLPSVSSGLVETVCSAVKAALLSDNIPGGGRALIGIITYDTSIHFYNLNPNLSQPQMLIVSDLSDLFLPLSDDILVNVADSTQSIINLLDNLPTLWRNNRVVENCMGSAIKAAFMAMRHIGGKMILFASTAPTVGDQAIKIRDHARQGGKDSEKVLDREVELLRPANDGYSNFVHAMVRTYISVDLFMCTSQPYVDLPTIAPIVKKTSGDLIYIYGFNAYLHGQKLREDIISVLTKSSAWEACLRFRVSRGWKITNWYGNFYFSGTDLLLAPSCHSDQSYSIVIDMEDNVTVAPDPFVYIQAALLHTNSDGERRIRVHTIALPATQNYIELASSMDVQATVSIICQQAMDISLHSKLLDGRNYLQTICSQILLPQSNQIAESAKSLPLYILGVLKCPAFKDCKEASQSDLRIYHWTRLASLRLESQIILFYPRLFCLSSWNHQQQENEQSLVLPPMLNLTAEQMTQSAAYLLEDGESMYLWLGRAIPTSFIQQIFGVASLDQLHPDYAETVIGSTGGPLGIKIAGLLHNIREQRKPPFMKLYVIRQGDPLENRFFQSLVEDKTQGFMLSYQDFFNKVMPRTTAAIPQRYAH
ncbi:Sec23/Sec24 trunk domain-containing protein [Cryptosporidium muris RN66]|uniref:Sec23/Sec24 trunk domain-containing protein n=1 Tax=Cryptosporidium muris (strain RN66) TaxID=441375 RepID=B6AA69_CRYMR|nr:Sec23/Sec24 trunk domain-containing protein [Cryptosporidium muris RN66]EEA05110.1 Sec23/Sec24 trunk domain-containing protein [Cryptosporidium muris RN66]|eukprot:XP_002139459.1 Sec23/Sec24 trunk domain-containing protein [Cryptosporidium muris RN66]